MKSLLAILLVTLAATCNEPQGKPLTQAEIDERLIEVNRQMLNSEGARIDAYADEQDWPMSRSGTGLRSWIYEDQEGIAATKGEVVDIIYTLRLMDGTLISKSKEGETSGFKIEGSNVETGLHEALQLMSEGDKAKFILPSHLAHGLIGDQKDIPPKSSLIYDVQLIRIR